MKKLTVIILAFLLFLTFFGCSPKVPEKINLHIDSSYSAEFEGIKLQGLLVYSETGEMYMDISTPDELSSLSFSWGESFTLGYHGLNAQTEEGYLPQSAFAETVKKTLDDLRLKNYSLDLSGNGSYYARCENSGGKYEVFTDQSGCIIELRLKDFIIKLNNRNTSARQ